MRTRFELAGLWLTWMPRSMRGAAGGPHPAWPSEPSPLLVGSGSVLAHPVRAGRRRRVLDTAIGLWPPATQEPTGTPSIRLAAARLWGAAAADTGQMHEAAEGFAASIGLLATVAWHGLDRSTRETQLEQLAGMVPDAAASSIRAGRPDQAVELLEQGRSVLWTQALNLRRDLTRLADEAPDLAERLNNIRTVLDGPFLELTSFGIEPTGGDGSESERSEQLLEATRFRRRKAREWDDVIAQVRALAGFEHFLAATPYVELATCAVDGPVVIVNASRYGCHALIIQASSDHARVVQLSDLSLEAALGQADRMLEALEGAADPMRSFLARENDRHVILDILEWLWETVAVPVLTALDYARMPDVGDPWPRLWWCPTGPLTVLPLHAAGRYSRNRAADTVSGESVLDRAITSYTPTLTALLVAHQSPAPALMGGLTIGMPATPSLPPLPAVPEEMRLLARYFPPDQLNHQLSGSQATRNAVLTAIASHSWLHMACHTFQQRDDPDHSGFALFDGALTITDLVSQRTHSRDLAFLSASQTAAGNGRYLDEAINLASAMHFLGFRSVIATMWTIADQPSLSVADTVYAVLTQRGSPNPSRSAEALHQAIRSLREEHPANPLIWAPYIHIGI